MRVRRAATGFCLVRCSLRRPSATEREGKWGRPEERAGRPNSHHAWKCGSGAAHSKSPYFHTYRTACAPHPVWRVCPGSGLGRVCPSSVWRVCPGSVWRVCPGSVYEVAVPNARRPSAHITLPQDPLPRRPSVRITVPQDTLPRLAARQERTTAAPSAPQTSPAPPGPAEGRRRNHTDATSMLPQRHRCHIDVVPTAPTARRSRHHAAHKPTVASMVNRRPETRLLAVKQAPQPARPKDRRARRLAPAAQFAIGGHHDDPTAAMPRAP
jgi:hypothetical protein